MESQTIVLFCMFSKNSFHILLISYKNKTYKNKIFNPIGAPSKLTCTKTTIIEKLSEGINRKSRIIMKDALIILKKVEKINKKMPNASVSQETNAPICSKSIQFLEENNVEVLNSSDI
ncbi:MAG: hypothetical protein GY834_13535 [Bacteroidetes bacterium]|nr:hypothetical protein [Bacteroidota bacterium]